MGRLPGGLRRKSVPVPCNYVQTSLALPMLTLRDRFLKDQRLRKGAFNALHIRRGDKARGSCDTSLGRVLAEVNSSSHRLLSTSPPRGGTRSPMVGGAAAGGVSSEVEAEVLPLVVFTDETDEAYLGQLFSALSRMGVAARHGDRVLRRMWHDEMTERATEVRYDNYALFLAATGVMAASSVEVHLCSRSCAITSPPQAPLVHKCIHRG